MVEHAPGIDEVELSISVRLEREDALPSHLGGCPHRVTRQQGAACLDRLRIEVDRENARGTEACRRRRVQAGAAADVEERTPPHAVRAEQSDQAVLGIDEPRLIDQGRVARPVLAERKTAVARIVRWTARQDGKSLQAPAAALTGMPFSLSTSCSSPAWNISRMISQPPTNSPFT